MLRICYLFVAVCLVMVSTYGVYFYVRCPMVNNKASRNISRNFPYSCAGHVNAHTHASMTHYNPATDTRYGFRKQCSGDHCQGFHGPSCCCSENRQTYDRVCVMVHCVIVGFQSVTRSSPSKASVGGECDGDECDYGGSVVGVLRLAHTAQL